MSEEVHKNPASANLAPEVERPVMIDGYLGRELSRLSLSSMAEPFGNDRFTEVFFETASGNQYAIGERDDELLLVNKQESLERQQRGERIMAKKLPDDVMKDGVLQLGRWFDYGKGYTTKVTKITAVNTESIYQSGDLEVLTGGQSSDARQSFWRGLTVESEREDKTELNQNISGDDEELVNIMLYPDKGAYSLYSDLVGDTHTRGMSTWNPEKQRKAQEGMRELFDVALDLVKLEEGDVDEARAGLRRLNTSPFAESTRDWLRRNGKQLKYQDTINYDRLKQTGAFLHFGVYKDDLDVPDRLPALVRVYATPKMEAVGHVAAEVIRRSRAQGYEPYGKVWDESSNAEPISPRKDRILFFAHTESQLKTVFGALGEIQAERPDLFEQNPPILAERTEVPGVGLAEEPPKVNGERRSFNESREALLEKAQELVLERLVGDPRPHMITSRGEPLDARLVELREAAARDRAVMERVIHTFRDAVRLLAPDYGVSPDNFSRNL